MSRRGQNRFVRVMLRIAPLGLALSILLSGCTALGLVVGSIADQSAGKGNADRLLSVGQGTRVTVWLNDGSKMHGKIMGFTGLPRTPGEPLPRFLPPGSGIVLQVQSTQRTIPAADVRRVSVPYYTAKWIGTAGGLLIDAAFVTWAMVSLSEDLSLE